MSYKKLFVFMLMSLFAISIPFVHAEEDKSKVAEAANKIIEGLPAAFKTGVDFSKMTPNQKTNWILNTVEGKVKSTVTEKFQDALKEKMENYAKEAIRAKAFMDIGIPQIKHAYAMGESFNWSRIDAEIASRADTNMNRLGAGIKAAQVTWATVQSYQRGDFTSAAKTLGGEIGNLLAESYIPGYGYFKVGAAMVEMLGNYVLDYATDTAVEGMLNNLYDMKSDPKGLAQWLMDKSPDAIMRDINDKFNDGMGFGYVYRGGGTDKGEEEIKSRLQNELISLRSRLVTQQKQAERREKQAQAEIEQYLAKYRDAQKELKAEAEKIKAEVDTQLAPITEFKAKMTSLRKQDVQEKLSEIQSKEGEISGGEGVPYAPFNYSSLISELETVYSEIKDTPSGYDREATSRMNLAYDLKKREDIKKVKEANKQNCQNAYAQVRNSYQPGINALNERIAATKDKNLRASLFAQVQALNKAYQTEIKKRQEACNANQQRLSLEILAFGEAEKIVKLEAQERADKLNEFIRSRFEEIKTGITNAQNEYEAAQKALVAEIQEKISFSEFFLYPDTYDQASYGSSTSSIVKDIQNGKLEVSNPGALHRSRENLLPKIEDIKKDISSISSYYNKEKKLLAEFQAKILAFENQYSISIPKNLKYIQAHGSDKEVDDRVQKYGTSAASSEKWGIEPPPLVSFKDIPELPAVMPTRFHSKQIQEMDQFHKLRVKKFQTALQNMQTELQAVDFYADLDRIAVSIISLNKNISGVLGKYIGVQPRFRAQDGKESIFVKAEESDGKKMLDEMKTAWEAAKPYVERMRKNVKAYGKGIKYMSLSDNPDAAIKRLPLYEAIPGFIEAHEKRMQETEQQRLASIKMAEDELAKLRADIDSLKDPEMAMMYSSTIKNLRNTFEQIFRIAKIDNTRSYFIEEYQALFDEMEEYANEHERIVKKRNEEYKKQLEREAAQAQAAKEAARKRQAEAESQRMFSAMNGMELAGFYGYSIENKRINSRSADNMRGQVILTKSDLIAGEIILEGRLFTLDKAKTMLLSEDGGRTWQELALNKNINYRFQPMPNKTYDFVLRIKTTDDREAVLKLFPGIDAIVYQDVDFEQLVAQTVKEIADAYEMMNASLFSDFISRDYLGNKAILEEGVRFDFDMFLNIRLTIYINRISQRGNMFVAETKWDKSQTPRKTGEEQKTSGKTTFMFVLEEGKMKIQNLRGDLIYATLSPQIAQASGKSSTVVEQIRTARDDRNPTQPGAGTTEDEGGLTSSGGGSVTLTVQTATFTSAVGMVRQEYIDFETGITGVGMSGGDIYFGGNTLNPSDGTATQIYRVGTGESTFNSLDTVPGAFADEGGGLADGGEVYVILTDQGNYVKMYISRVNQHPEPNDNYFDTTIKYAISPDGSTNLKTQ